MQRNKGKRNHTPSLGGKAREVLKNIDLDNPIIQMFQSFAKELDDKHDRYERIVKLSRDITIESKRIIFALHSIIDPLQEKEKLENAEKRLVDLVNTKFKEIATELENRDPYQYHRAFTGGIQEFLEGYSLYMYLKTGEISQFGDLQALFDYKKHDLNMNLMFNSCDYLLGIGDFTGEMMRRCITGLGSGDVESCFKLCEFVKNIYTTFLGLSYTGNKEVPKKLFVLKQSLTKMELVCYNIKIRGEELPKHMLVNAIESSDMVDDDEGVFF